MLIYGRNLGIKFYFILIMPDLALQSDMFRVVQAHFESSQPFHSTYRACFWKGCLLCKVSKTLLLDFILFLFIFTFVAYNSEFSTSNIFLVTMQVNNCLHQFLCHTMLHSIRIFFLSFFFMLRPLEPVFKKTSVTSVLSHFPDS